MAQPVSVITIYGLLSQVEVAFSGVEDKGSNIKSENTSTPMKVLPPWMIRQGMVLTNEQRGEVKQESNIEGTSTAADLSEDKKSVDQKDDKNLQASLNNLMRPFQAFFFLLNIISWFLMVILQDEYFKAYYAALLQRQQEQEESIKVEQESFNTTEGSSRQVGMKAKREDYDNDERDENVEWEEARTTGRY